MELSRRKFILQATSELVSQSAVENKRRELLEIALRILSSNDPEKFLESPYLISVFCYSSRYLKSLSEKPSRQLSPTEKLISELSKYISPSLSKMFFNHHLNQIHAHIAPQNLNRSSKPLQRYSWGTGPNHPNALDIFTDEGDVVFFSWPGRVLAVEENWNPLDRLSTSSYNGGNTLTSLHPQGRITRLAHLSKSNARAGQFLNAGAHVGYVGHTGQNASKPGHGGHVHIEIRELEPQTFARVSLSSSQMKQLIEQAGSPLKNLRIIR